MVSGPMRFRLHYRLSSVVAVLLLLAPASEAAFRRHRAANSHHSSLSLRRRLHVNPLITETGTVEMEWNSLYTGLNGDYSMPATLKYTPEGPSLWWGWTEYSTTFDLLEAYPAGGQRPVHLSDRASVTATALLLDRPQFDLAIAPQVTALLRGDSGLRAGATVIGRFDLGRTTLGLTLGWSGATVPSASNPAGTMDWGLGAGQRLAAAGWWSRVTPHANFIYERSTSMAPIRGLFEGIEYQINGKLAVDISGQHLATPGVPVDHQLLVGVTFNLGRWR